MQEAGRLTLHDVNIDKKFKVTRHKQPRDTRLIKLNLCKPSCDGVKLKTHPIPEGGWHQQGHAANRLPRLTGKVSIPESPEWNIAPMFSWIDSKWLPVDYQMRDLKNESVTNGWLSALIAVGEQSPNSCDTHGCPASCSCCVMLGSRTLNNDVNQRIKYLDQSSSGLADHSTNFGYRPRQTLLLARINRTIFNEIQHHITKVMVLDQNSHNKSIEKITCHSMEGTSSGASYTDFV